MLLGDRGRGRPSFSGLGESSISVSGVLGESCGETVSGLGLAEKSDELEVSLLECGSVNVVGVVSDKDRRPSMLLGRGMKADSLLLAPWRSSARLPGRDVDTEAERLTDEYVGGA